MSQKHIEGYRRKADQAHPLFDHLRRAHNLKNDAALAREAKIGSASISKIRGGKPMTDSILVKLHERFGITFRDMRALLGQTENA